MAQEFNGRTLIAEARVHLQAIPSGCFGVNVAARQGFLQRIWLISVTIILPVPQTFFHLSPTLFKFNNSEIR
jgi:hypothetical protein